MNEFGGKSLVGGAPGTPPSVSGRFASGKRVNGCRCQISQSQRHLPANLQAATMRAGKEAA